jgi:mono/diheme cytochrome c family protein
MMLMRALAVAGLLLAAPVLAQTQATPAVKPPAGNAASGRQLFTKMSCSYCHGTEAHGSAAAIGPRVALVARSYDSFARYVRQPSGRMTAYSEQILSDGALADIYAFLRSLPAARPVGDIPLLEQLRKRQ